MKPIIGITSDRVDPAEEEGGRWYARHPWYALRERYCTAVYLAGGIPVMVPYVEDIPAYVSMLDGLVISGGGFDIDPALYGVKEKHPTVNIRPLRTQFEMALTKAMLDANKPILGICGGLQIINVLLGGTLIQHIPDEVSSDINHVQVQDRDIPQHMVDITPNTLLGALAHEKQAPVNSIHHQAVKTLGSGLVENARSPDGIIEGVESTQHKFCLGVQWHPEFHVSPLDTAILDAFIQACRNS